MNRGISQTVSPEYDILHATFLREVREHRPGYGMHTLGLLRRILPDLLEAERTETPDPLDMTEAFRPTDERISPEACRIIEQALRDEFPGKEPKVYVLGQLWQEIQNADEVLIEAALNDVIEEEAPRTDNMVRLRNTLDASEDDVRAAMTGLSDREKFLILACLDLLSHELRVDNFTEDSDEFLRDRATEFRTDPQIGVIAKAVLASADLHEIE